MADSATGDLFDRGLVALVDTLPGQGVLRLTPDGVIAAWNVGAERLFGWTSAQAVGRPGAIIFTPEDIAEGVPLREMEGARAHGQSIDDRWHLRADGTRLHVTGTMTAVRDQAGELRGFVKIVVDDTDKVRRLREAQEHELILAALLSQVPIGILIVAGTPHLRIVRVSEHAARMLGISRPRLEGAPLDPASPPWALEAADGSGQAPWPRMPLSRALGQGEQILNEEWTLVTNDGRRLPILSNAAPLRDQAGTVVGAVTTFVDISARLDYEDRLRHANQELEQFAFIASHDLQEPLRMVGSYLGLLQRKYGQQLDTRANEYIEFAVDGAARMQKLIRSLLDYARLDRAELTFERIDAASALEEALANLSQRVAKAGARVEHDRLPTISADRDQLVRLFQNLIGNGIKYCHRERAPVVEVRAARDGSGWTFSVGDNGIGIADEDRERVFALFQRLHSRDEYPGTGLGLAICKRIVERHGGRIWVDSRPGEGSTFRFHLPDWEPPGRPDQAPADRVPEGAAGGPSMSERDNLAR